MNPPAGMFAPCPLPGCGNLTDDPRQPCQECRAAFGPRLREAGGPPVSAETAAAKLAERDQATRRALTAQAAVVVQAAVTVAVSDAASERRAVERRRNQLCWVCDERRSCRQDTAFPGGRWICRDCEAIPA